MDCCIGCFNVLFVLVGCFAISTGLIIQPTSTHDNPQFWQNKYYLFIYPQKCEQLPHPPGVNKNHALVKKRGNLDTYALVLVEEKVHNWHDIWVVKRQYGPPNKNNKVHKDWDD